MNNYYTYAYLTLNRRPYYIGMGSGDRAYKSHPTMDVCMPDSRELIIILKRNLTQEEAWKHEIYMINVLGRQCDGGILFNQTKGGSGWGGGTVATPERKQKIGDANRGRVLSVEHKRKLSDAKKGKKADPTHVAKRARSRNRSITLVSPTKEVITFASHSEAAKVIGTHYTTMSHLKTGRRRTANGWTLFTNN